MKAASIHELRQELKHCDTESLQNICLRLIRHKVENKELATYLLFEAHNEEAYRQSLRSEIATLFETVPTGGNTYYTKKSLRKVVRFANRQIKFSGNNITELEIRLHLCQLIIKARIQRAAGTVLGNIYHQQVKKIEKIFERLEEDLQADYEGEVRAVSIQ